MEEDASGRSSARNIAPMSSCGTKVVGTRLNSRKAAPKRMPIRISTNAVCLMDLRTPLVYFLVNLSNQVLNL